MKKLVKTMFLATLTAAMMFTSCSKDEDDPTPTPLPTPTPDNSAISVSEITGSSAFLDWDDIEGAMIYEVTYTNTITNEEETVESEFSMDDDAYLSEVELTGLDGETKYNVTIVGQDMMFSEVKTITGTFTTTEQTAPTTIDLLALSPADGGTLDSRMKKLTFSAQWDGFSYSDDAFLTIYINYDGDVQFTEAEKAIIDEDWGASMNSSYGIAIPSEFLQSGETANWVAEFRIEIDGEEPVTVKSEQYSFVAP
jgi:hypothetical protein